MPCTQIVISQAHLKPNAAIPYDLLQDNWDRFVEANWAPTLRSAFGKRWKHTVGNEVPAMLQLSRQNGRQNTDMASSTSWSRQDPTASSSHAVGSADQTPHTIQATLSPQAAAAAPSSAPSGLQLTEPAVDSTRNGMMDDWADIFDQCSIAVNRSDPNHMGSERQQDPRSFAGFMPGPPGSRAGPVNGAFESIKSLNSEEAEECMFGDSDDEEEGPQSGNNGPQRLPFFGGVADWPVKQMLHLPVSPPTPLSVV